VIVSGSVDRSQVSAVSAELKHKADQAYAAWCTARGAGTEETAAAAWREYSRAGDARVQFSRALDMIKAVLDT
jgi:hypothetical protein